MRKLLAIFLLFSLLITVFTINASADGEDSKISATCNGENLVIQFRDANLMHSVEENRGRPDTSRVTFVDEEGKEWNLRATEEYVLENEIFDYNSLTITITKDFLLNNHITNGTYTLKLYSSSYEEFKTSLEIRNLTKSLPDDLTIEQCGNLDFAIKTSDINFKKEVFCNLNENPEHYHLAKAVYENGMANQPMISGNFDSETSNVYFRLSDVSSDQDCTIYFYFYGYDGYKISYNKNYSIDNQAVIKQNIYGDLVISSENDFIINHTDRIRLVSLSDSTSINFVDFIVDNNNLVLPFEKIKDSGMSGGIYYVYLLSGKNVYDDTECAISEIPLYATIDLWDDMAGLYENQTMLADEELFQAISNSLLDNQNIKIDQQLSTNDIIFTTRTIGLSSEETIQTWMPYFLSDVYKLGVDYSNSVPIKTYITNIAFYNDGDCQKEYAISSTNLKPYDIGADVAYGIWLSPYDMKKLKVNSIDDFENVVLGITTGERFEAIDYSVELASKNGTTESFYISFKYNGSHGSLLLYNKNNVKKARDIKTPVVYAFENDFEGMKLFVDAQLKDDWKVFDKTDDVEQKLYPYYDTDKYLAGVVNEGEDGYVDVYKVLETEWAIIPEIQAKQNENGDLIISYKDMAQVEEYNDFLSNSSYPTFEIETASDSANIIKGNSIKVDKANKTWTYAFEDLVNYSGLTYGEKYKIVIHPNLFGVETSKENFAECVFTATKTWPYTVDLLPIETSGQSTAKEYLLEYYGNKYQGSVVTIDKVAVEYTKYVSNDNLNKYFKVYGLNYNNCIPLDISLSVQYTVDGTSTAKESNVPYDYPNQYIDVVLNVSFETMNKIGITEDNLSDITVLREHNGKVDELAATVEPIAVNDMIISYKATFKTDKMSLFALVNKNSIVRPSSGGSGGGTSSVTIPSKKAVVNTVAK